MLALARLEYVLYLPLSVALTHNDFHLTLIILIRFGRILHLQLLSVHLLCVIRLILNLNLRVLIIADPTTNASQQL